jgi:hypothetical protein
MEFDSVADTFGTLGIQKVNTPLCLSMERYIVRLSVVF